MDPTELIGPTSPLGYPAPFWFVQLFKVLGFTLHMIPMNLWYAGLILAALVYWLGGEQGRRLATRLVSPMPIVVALGINLGIVPLLFTQVAYYQVFYPATILMAWFWFSIVGLLIVAYYGVYIYVSALRDVPDRWTPLKRLAGWVSAIMFIVIGFLFANSMSLMANIDGWPALAAKTNAAGAVTGLALNIWDGTLIPRWLMMFGLALTTTAAYLIIDVAFFARKETATYREWATRAALVVYTLGLIWFAVAGTWYITSLLPITRQAMFGSPVVILTVLTALAPGLPWLLIVSQRRKGVTRSLAALTGGAQFGVLGLNAISRQYVQGAELARYVQIGNEPVYGQWSPLALFLILFVAGLGVVAWMVAQVVKNESSAASG